MQLAAAEDLYYFKKQVIHKMTEWPFYYTARNSEEQYVIFIIITYLKHNKILKIIHRVHYTLHFYTMPCICMRWV